MKTYSKKHLREPERYMFYNFKQFSRSDLGLHSLAGN